jgi:hypothetical protein
MVAKLSAKHKVSARQGFVEKTSPAGAAGDTGRPRFGGKTYITYQRP